MRLNVYSNAHVTRPRTVRIAVFPVLWVRHHFDIWFPVLDYSRFVVQKAMVANNEGDRSDGRSDK